MKQIRNARELQQYRRRGALYIGFVGLCYAAVVTMAADKDLSDAIGLAVLGVVAVLVYGAIVRSALQRVPWWLQ